MTVQKWYNLSRKCISNFDLLLGQWGVGSSSGSEVLCLNAGQCEWLSLFKFRCTKRGCLAGWVPNQFPLIFPTYNGLSEVTHCKSQRICNSGTSRPLGMLRTAVRDRLCLPLFLHGSLVTSVENHCVQRINASKAMGSYSFLAGFVTILNKAPFSNSQILTSQGLLIPSLPTHIPWVWPIPFHFLPVWLHLPSHHFCPSPLASEASDPAWSSALP